MFKEALGREARMLTVGCILCVPDGPFVLHSSSTASLKIMSGPSLSTYFHNEDEERQEAGVRLRTTGVIDYI